jgi:tetratricopeptide (TPR) repeat protein
VETRLRGRPSASGRRALAQLGELEQAAGIAMEVAGVLSERPEEAGQSYSVLAKTFADAGERDKAIELFELACDLLERTPNRFLVEAYADLADLLESEGRRDEAYELMRRAMRARVASTQAVRSRTQLS